MPTDEELRRFFSSAGAEVTDADGREAVEALLLERLSFVISAGPSVLLIVLFAGEDENVVDTGEALVIASACEFLFEFGIATDGAMLSGTGGAAVGDEAGEPLSLPPNILFRRPPPDEEKLLLGLPASVLTVWESCLMAQEL